MLIQGPLLLNWRNRTGPGRLLPRIENANLQANQPPTMNRLDLWIRARVQVRARPDLFPGGRAGGLYDSLAARAEAGRFLFDEEAVRHVLGRGRDDRVPMAGDHRPSLEAPTATPKHSMPSATASG